MLFAKSKPNESRWSWNSKLAAFLGLLIWIVAPLVVWIGWGTDQLETYLTLNALPVGLVWNGLLVVALVDLARRRFARLAIFATLALALWLIGYAPLSNQLIDLVEGQYPTKSPEDFEKPFRAIVMLGGCTHRLADGRPEVTEEGERIVATAEFWHAGKTEWIVATARRGDDEDDARDASLMARDLLVGLGVPPEKILRIGGRNTSEEISATLQLLDSPPADFGNSTGPIGLVTSAFHMPRAMKLATTKGLDVIPLPSGHRARHRPWEPPDLIPRAATIDNNSVLMREFLARAVGR